MACGICAGKVRARFCCGKLKESDHLEYLCVDRKIILKWTLDTQDGRPWTGFIWLMVEECGRFM